MSRTSTADKLFLEIDALLTYLALAEHEFGKKHYHRIPLSHFDGAEIFNEEVAPTCYGIACKQDKGIFIDVKPNDVDGQWDASMIGNVIPDGTEREGDFLLYRFRNVPPKSLRGKMRLTSLWCGEFTVGCVSPERGTYFSGRFPANLGCDGFWRFYTQPDYAQSRPESSLGTQNGDVEQHNICQMLLGIHFTRNYQWRVLLGYENSPRVSLPTDPTGARALFKLRDIPEDRQRRAALRNWVIEHARQQRTAESDEVWVREHLRGAIDFGWKGLRCTILPSPHDLARNRRLAEAKRQRRIEVYQ